VVKSKPKKFRKVGTVSAKIPSMTILEASNKLFDWFSKKDHFMLVSKLKADSKENHLNELLLVSDDLETDRVCVQGALEHFEELGFVKHIKTENKDYWILKKPFDTYEQTVAIDPALANSISQIINDFNDSIKDKTDYCDASKLSTKDIRNLVIIAIHLIGK
jgi:hypothetical protein